jgi:hypothetical protein
MAVGGDILEVTYNHPTLGSGTLFAKAAEDGTFGLGGFQSADDDSMIDGGGNMIDQITRKRWSFEGTISWDMNLKTELEKLTAMQGSPVLADWTISHINGTVYGGKGKPVGDTKGNTNAATIPLKLQGSGQLKKIVG